MEIHSVALILQHLDRRTDTALCILRKEWIADNIKNTHDYKLIILRALVDKFLLAKRVIPLMMYQFIWLI